MNYSLLPEKTAVSTPNNQTLLMAWLGMLLLSRLPQIIAQEFLGIDLGTQILWFWLGIGIVLIAAANVWPALGLLRGYFVVMTAVYGATAILNGMVATTVWQTWFGGEETAWTIRFFGERLGVVLLALVITAVLLLMGQSRRDIFLVWGNWQRPTGLRLPGRSRLLTWAVVGR